MMQNSYIAKNALFITLTLIITPLTCGITTGEPFGFTLASNLIGGPLSLLIAALATAILLILYRTLFIPVIQHYFKPGINVDPEAEHSEPVLTNPELSQIAWDHEQRTRPSTTALNGHLRTTSDSMRPPYDAEPSNPVADLNPFDPNFRYDPYRGKTPPTPTDPIPYKAGCPDYQNYLKSWRYPHHHPVFPGNGNGQQQQQIESAQPLSAEELRQARLQYYNK